MTRGQRKLLYRISGMGLLLTLLVIAADGLGGLDPLERYLYDLRARQFQFFSPPPSDKIVHIDIDDPSLQEIGRWPWPRSTLAKLIEEMNLAGAKVIALDILLTQPQQVEPLLDASNNIKLIDHDQILADTIQRCGNVLVPITIAFQPLESRTTIRVAMVKLLDADPELELSELETALRAQGFTQPNLRDTISDNVVDASAEAMFDRLTRELSSHMMTADEIQQKVLPKASIADEIRPVRVLLQRTYPTVVSFLRLRKFGQPAATSQVQQVLHGRPMEAPLPSLCDATAFTGYVDLPTSDDGKVRSIPIVADYLGQLMPHMVLATACAALGVDAKELKYANDSVTIPLSGQPSIVIPVRVIRSKTYGKSGMFMELPWYGTSDFTTMFDAPNHVEQKQHVAIRNIWSVALIDQSIERNQRTVDTALASLLEVAVSPADAEAYLKVASKLTREERTKRVEQALNDETIKSNYEVLAQMSPSEQAALGPIERALLTSYRTLKEIPERERALREQQTRRRVALRKQLEGKTLMVGWSATGATDTYPTSLQGQWPGVAIMGAAINGILTRHHWTALPWWISAIATLCMGALTTLAVARLSPVPALLTSAALLAAYGTINGLLLFDLNDQLLPAAGTVTAIALCWSGLTLARFIFESRERRRITQRFSNYVDPALVDYVIENPEQVQLDGKVREMTVVFTDLAGFTTISEKLREKTVPILNEYMSLMVPIIREHSGYWDKFLGDGIMFFYNGLAPLSDHAIRAIDTAMEMQIVTQRFNARLRERQLPNVAMRAGISTGEMVVGDAGSKDAVHRANNFTVLGDAVNLGARLEGANKPIGTKILINGRTAELSEGKFLLRPVGNVRVVGKLEGVQLFEPLSRMETATDDQKKIVEFATTIVETFADADFEKCICTARKMEEELGSTKFSQFYMRIAREHIDNPTSDFEGQIVLSEK